MTTTETAHDDINDNGPDLRFESPITQVPEAPPPAPAPLASQYYIPSSLSGRSHVQQPQKIILDLQGTRFELERETLINLPESILVVMFPNGLLLRPQPPTPSPPVQTRTTPLSSNSASLSSSSASTSSVLQMQPVSPVDAAVIGAAVAAAGPSGVSSALAGSGSGSGTGTTVTTATGSRSATGPSAGSLKTIAGSPSSSSSSSSSSGSGTGSGTGTINTAGQAGGNSSFAGGDNSYNSAMLTAPTVTPTSATTGGATTLEILKEDEPIVAATPTAIGKEAVGTTTTADLGSREGISSIGLSPMLSSQPLQRQRSNLHRHHPSESTSFTDYSDYSDYSYYDDDDEDYEDYDEEEDDEDGSGSGGNRGGNRYHTRGDLEDEEEDGEDDEDQGDDEGIDSGQQEPEVILVDFDPDCLRYILSYYETAKKAGLTKRLQRLQTTAQFKKQMQQHRQQQQQHVESGIVSTPSTAESDPRRQAPGVKANAEAASRSSSSSSSNTSPTPLASLAPQHPLLDRQAIIILREELDYFAIPPPSAAALARQQSAIAVQTAPVEAVVENLNIPSSSSATETGKEGSGGGGGDDSASSSRPSVEDEPPLLGRTPSATAASVAAAATTKAKALPRGKGKAPMSAVDLDTVSTSLSSAPSSPSQPPTPPPPPPPKDTGPSSSSAPNAGLLKPLPTPPPPKMIKTQCGQHLVNERKIFAALQRNIEKAKNKAEQHLMDMLCVSGFDRDGEWGYRRLQPQRTSVVGVAMVMLKTSASPSTDSAIDAETVTASQSLEAETSTTEASSSSSPDSVAQIMSPEQKRQQQEELDRHQLAIAQKLLLFWRKPARKCWWDRVEIEIDQDPTDRVTTTTVALEATVTSGASSSTPAPSTNVDHHNDTQRAKVPIKLWARRTWTLELVLV